MALSEHHLQDDIHPIDIVENLASFHDWEFDRIADDQIAMAVEGQWRTYSLTLAWSDYDETLRLVCSYEMDPPEGKVSQLYELINNMNDQCWAGAFSYWPEHKLMLFRYGLVLAGGQMATPEQVDAIVQAAVSNCERYYPAIQLMVWGERSCKDAMQVAIAEAYGRA
ncbi:MAG: diacylglyceryl transferase [Halobacteriovoraceae bacterium]|nr:diacylglyceryl transferase [Halobacteriovoraceae bacterium]